MVLWAIWCRKMSQYPGSGFSGPAAESDPRGKLFFSKKIFLWKFQNHLKRTKKLFSHEKKFFFWFSKKNVFVKKRKRIRFLRQIPKICKISEEAKAKQSRFFRMVKKSKILRPKNIIIRIMLFYVVAWIYFIYRSVGPAKNNMCVKR